jgi:hypothetical protein
MKTYIGWYSEDGYLLCPACADEARRQLGVPDDAPTWTPIRTAADFRDDRRTCLCGKECETAS